MLDAMESSAKGNDTKVISTENIEKINVKKSKKEESNLFLFQVINLGDQVKVTFSGKLLDF